MPRKKVHSLPRTNQKLSMIDGSVLYGKMRSALTATDTFKRAYGYYSLLSLVIFSGFLFSLFNLIIQKSVPVLIIWALLFSFFSVQISGLFHDAGHRAVFKTTWMNDIFGYICGIVLATGYTQWKTKHNMHHAHPNQEGEDPDVDIPYLSFTKERFQAKKGLVRLLRKYQAYLYFPLGSLVVFTVRLSSFTYLIKNYNKKFLWEIILLLCGFFLWYGLPFFIFGVSKSLLLLIVINMSMGFYLLNVFAPNHKGMPQLANGVKISFMEQQILTSRNIHGHWLTDIIYMGLNYQIEHHLFPNTPRNKLKRITPFVLDICRKKKLEYTQTSIIGSNKIILAELKEVASSV